MHQAFMKLPGELRNIIWEMVIPKEREVVKRHVHPRSRGWSGGLPPVLQVCRFFRQELYPLFYSTNLFTVCLEDLLMHPKSINRAKSSVNLLPKEGNLYLRNIKIESCARCFHSGWARQPNVIARVDRSEGTITCQPPRLSRFLEPCCQAAAKKYSARLISQIEACGFQDGKRKIRREDFERLMRRMDESRRDWPKSPRRVVPRYYTT